jgi:hypothetical protein
LGIERKEVFHSRAEEWFGTEELKANS